MQRSFSTFPAGLPGAGLLLMRITVGISLLTQGIISLIFSSLSPWGIKVFGLCAVIIGVALLAGFLTPLAGALAGLGNVSVALSWISTPLPQAFYARLSFMLIAIMAVAIVFLGPGAFSLDCRLFGRREIIIPSNARAPRP